MLNLKENQIMIYNDLCKFNGNKILLNLHTGFGKTILIIKYLEQFKNKNILITSPKILINEQWRKLCNEYLKNNNINIYTTTKLCNILKNNKTLNYDYFIIDECHLCENSLFNKIINNINYKLLIGLTATIKNIDLFNNFFEKIIFKNKESIRNVKKIKLDFKPLIKYNYYTKKIDYNIMNNSLINNIERLEYISNIIKFLLFEKYKNSLILCKNIKTIEYILNYLKNNINDYNILYIYKNMSKIIKINNNKTYNILIGTYSKIGTGFDLNSIYDRIFILDNLLDIRQAEGRIRNIKYDIIDFVDDHFIYEYHWKKRNEFYKKFI